MNTLEAFAMGMANKNKEKRVFDWAKAAKIIREKKPEYAAAGLEEDLEWTQDTIYEDGKPAPARWAWLSSTWATPILILPDEDIKCWKWQHEVPDWGPKTNWPEEAIKILNEGG